MLFRSTVARRMRAAAPHCVDVQTCRRFSSVITATQAPACSTGASLQPLLQRLAVSKQWLQAQGFSSAAPRPTFHPRAAYPSRAPFHSQTALTRQVTLPQGNAMVPLFNGTRARLRTRISSSYYSTANNPLKQTQQSLQVTFNQEIGRASCRERV